MNKRVFKRLLVLFAVAAVSLLLLASRGIPLGLDLRGGSQIILQVLVDDVLKAETEATLATLREDLLPEIGKPATATSVSMGEIAVTGLEASALEGHIQGWDVAQHLQHGLPVTTLRLPEAGRRSLREEATIQTMRVIENRLDGFGVSEITIQRYGDPENHQIQIQIPGTRDPQRIHALLKSTGLLEFRMVDRGPFQTAKEAMASYGGAVPSEIEILPSREGGEARVHYAIWRTVSLSGRHLRTATSSLDPSGRPAVGFTLNVEGADRFAKLTEGNIGKQMAIILDGVVQSAPFIETKIENTGIIQGGSRGFTTEQVRDLILVLRSGALPARTRPDSEHFVGPSLGDDSIRAGIVASAIALGAVSTAVTVYYRKAGLNAVAAMLFNLLILLGAMAAFQATLTLPGIAGIVLTIGMGIDSNVLIFERIREELREGKAVGAAISAGFHRVFRTLIDTHLAALIGAAILFTFSSGAVRGFAVTLAIGLLANLFTSVFVSRTLFECQRKSARLSI